jgi:hypothetical protein
VAQFAHLLGEQRCRGIDRGRALGRAGSNADDAFTRAVTPVSADNRTTSVCDGRQPLSGSTELVVVPRIPGPVIRVDDLSLGSRDEVDEVVRELFGEPIEQSPGRLDAVLIVVGAGLIGWSLLVNQSGGWLALGIIALLLGLALPLSSVRRSMRGRRNAKRTQRLLAAGSPLDTTHIATIHMLSAYDDLVQATARDRSSDATDALAAGHLALTEVASLLHGRAPQVPAEITYINRRTAAIRELDRALRQQAEKSVLATHGLATPRDRNDLEASALVLAREQVAELDSEDSLDELGRVTRRVHARSEVATKAGGAINE